MQQAKKIEEDTLDARSFKTRGFIIKSQFFSKGEIESMRKVSVHNFETLTGQRYHGGRAFLDFLNKREFEPLWPLVSNKKLLKKIAELFQDDFIYCNQSDLLLNAATTWHADVPDLKLNWISPLPLLIKAVVYFQDHLSHPAIYVREGSHLPNTRHGKEIGVRLRAGDVLFFDMRLWHKGASAIPFVPIRLASKLTKLLGIKKVAAFYTFGRVHPETEKHKGQLKDALKDFHNIPYELDPKPPLAAYLDRHRIPYKTGL